jgi:hypothetical protein
MQLRLAFVMLAGCATTTTQTDEAKVGVGDALPFTLPDLEGAQTSSDQLRG